jgi:hypothetical protein
MSAIAVRLAIRIVVVIVCLLLADDLRVMWQGGWSQCGDALDRLFGLDTSARIVVYARAAVLGSVMGVRQVKMCLRAGVSPRKVLERHLRRRTYLTEDREGRARIAEEP